MVNLSVASQVGKFLLFQLLAMFALNFPLSVVSVIRPLVLDNC